MQKIINTLIQRFSSITVALMTELSFNSSFSQNASITVASMTELSFNLSFSQYKKGLLLQSLMQSGLDIFFVI